MGISSLRFRALLLVFADDDLFPELFLPLEFLFEAVEEAGLLLELALLDALVFG